MAAGKGNQSNRRRATRILLVDDHPLVRTGLAEVLRREPDFEVCGEAEDRSQALDAIAATKPDLTIVDLSLKKSSGLELVKDIRARFPTVRVLVVSMHDELHNVERALRAGASGYISKTEATTQVVEAIRQVLSGEAFLCPRVATQMAARMVGHPHPEESPGVKGLTDRELQIFELLGQGFNRQKVAEQLHLGVNTVETYRSRLKEKLNLKDANELLQYAIRWNRGTDLRG